MHHFNWLLVCGISWRLRLSWHLTLRARVSSNTAGGGLRPVCCWVYLSNWLQMLWTIDRAAGWLLWNSRQPQAECHGSTVLHIPLSNTLSMLCIHNTDSCLLEELSSLLANIYNIRADRVIFTLFGAELPRTSCRLWCVSSVFLLDRGFVLAPVLVQVTFQFVKTTRPDFWFRCWAGMQFKCFVVVIHTFFCQNTEKINSWKLSVWWSFN